MLVVEALLDAGYTVDQAANGAEALERLHHAVPDTVVLDVMMPRINAYEFVARIRDDLAFRAIPIIVMTAAYAAPMIAHQLGARAVVPKPFEVDALLNTVERVLADAGATATPA